MKRTTLLALLLLASLYAWSERGRFMSRVEREMAPEAEAFPKAVRSAAQERSRVDQAREVDAAEAGKDVTDGMSPDEVRRLWGEPASVDQDRANREEIWHYPVIHRRVVFRDTFVRNVESE